jgi:hypothetical protein
MGWTDERVELLKKLWQDGLSASQIAKQLGGVTRNAVIGKLHQQGLTRDAVRANGGGMMAASPNKGVKTKVLSVDHSPAELLRPRRFTWEDAQP